MFGSVVLEVAIGVVFVYLLLSLIVTAVTELISGWLKWRSQNLWEGIRNLVDSGQATEWITKLYDHALIQGLSPAEKPAPPPAAGAPDPAPAADKVEGSVKAKGPSYIPSRTFAVALLETLKDSDPAGQLTIKALRRAVDTVPNSASTTTLKTDLAAAVANLPDTGAGGDLKAEALAFINRIPDSVALTDVKKDVQAWLTGLPSHWLRMVIDNLPSNSKLKRSLAALLDESHGDAERLKTNIEVWFNNSMERVSGWYKRRTQLVHIVLAACVTIFVNVDSILVINALSQSEALRKSVVAEAEAYAKHQAESGALPAPVTDSETSTATEAKKSLAPPAATPGLTTEPMTSEALTTEPMTSEPMTTETVTSGPVTTEPASTETFKRLRSQIAQLNLPVGWVLPKQAATENRDFRKWPGWWWEPGKENDWAILWAETIRFHFFGWLLTAFAISLGAPFWFDMLNKIINIRAAGKSPEERSKAPQAVPQPREAGGQTVPPAK